MLRGIAAGLGVSSLGAIARAARSAEALSTTTVAPGLTVLSGAGGNIVVLATGAGKVLVDSGTAASSQALLESVGRLPGGNVTLRFKRDRRPLSVKMAAAARDLVDVALMAYITDGMERRKSAPDRWTRSHVFTPSPQPRALVGSHTGAVHRPQSCVGRQLQLPLVGAQGNRR